jgi:hypothetical protein
MLRSFVEVREAAAAAFSATRAPLCRTPPFTTFLPCLKTPFSLTYVSSCHQWTKLREMIFFSRIFKFLWMKSPTSGQSQSPTAGVPWAACNGALVYGWAPSDAVTAVRLTGVPVNLLEAAIRAHFAQFGRVTRVFRSKDKVFTRACNGIVQISIAVAPGFALPAFVCGRRRHNGQEDAGPH